MLRTTCSRCLFRRYSTTTTSKFSNVVSDKEYKEALINYSNEMSRIRKEFAEETKEFSEEVTHKVKEKSKKNYLEIKERKKRKKEFSQKQTEEKSTIDTSNTISLETNSDKQTAQLRSIQAREERLHHLINLFHLAGGSETSRSFSLKNNPGIVSKSSVQESGRHPDGFITKYEELDTRIESEFGKENEPIVIVKPFRSASAKAGKMGHSEHSASLTSETIASGLTGAHPADAADFILGDKKLFAEERLRMAREWLEGYSTGYSERGYPTRAVGVRAILLAEEKEAKKSEKRENKMEEKKIRE